MDGLTATREIKKIAQKVSNFEEGEKSTLKYPPIVAMTANAVKGDRERFLETGMVDYVTKPLRRKQLLELVAKWLPSDVPESFPAPVETEPLPVDNGRRETLHRLVQSDEPMDFNGALKEFLGKKDILLKVIKGFLDKAESQIEDLHQSIAASDMEAVRLEAHSIKGAAANLKADDLAQAASDLEKAGQNRDASSVQPLLDQVINELLLLQVFVMNLEEDI
jgi:HPt (histidine-containing phosphotransfer) domain-containing protein